MTVEVGVTPSVVVVVEVAVAPFTIATPIAEITAAGGRGGVTPVGRKATEICTLELSGTELGFVVSVGLDDSSVSQYAIST